MTEEKPQIATLHDNKNEHPIEYYSERFAQANPAEMARRSGVLYDAENQWFTVHLLGREVRLAWPSMETVCADTGAATAPNVRILLGHLVLEHQLVPGSGTFVPYAQIPWGQAYLKAFTGRCINRLAFMFKSASQFSLACEKLGGMPAADGDASYDFEFVDGVFVRLVVWEADDEFPPSAQILFSDNTQLAFTAEDLAAVGDILLGALKSCRE